MVTWEEPCRNLPTCTLPSASKRRVLEYCWLNTRSKEKSYSLALVAYVGLCWTHSCVSSTRFSPQNCALGTDRCLSILVHESGCNRAYTLMRAVSCCCATGIVVRSK
jgi:hypothetical protein